MAGGACTALISGALVAGPALASPAVPQDGATATTLSLSSNTIAYGSENAERLNIGVHNTGMQGSSPPTGQVTVLEGSTVVCTIDLAQQVGSCNLAFSQLPPGAHTLHAAYRSDGNNQSSVSLDTILTVVRGQPSADFSLEGGDGRTMEWGNEDMMPALIVVHQPGSAVPTGTVVAAQSGGPTLCSANLVGGNGNACFMSRTALEPGAYQLLGSYSGDANYANATSAPLGIVVTRDVTHLAQAVPQSGVPADQEGEAVLSFTITPDADVAGTPPGGAVTFSANGTTLCTANLPGTLSASCRLTDGELPVGNYVVSANYSGDPHYVPSSAPQAALVISVPVPAATSTSLTVSVPTVTFGHEQVEKLSVQVISERPAVAGKVAPQAASAGSVVIKAGSVTVCTVTLDGDTASCTVGASKLKPGKYQLTARYGGNSTLLASTSAPAALTVAAEPTATTLKLSAAKVKAGQEQSEKLSVQVAPKFGGKATGQVTVKAGSVKLCVIALKAGIGSCKLKASQLKAGTYHLTAGYAAATPFAASASAQKTLTVTKK